MNIQDIIKNHYNVDQFIEMVGDNFPLLKRFKETQQDTVWHAEGDVHIHTDMVLNETYDIIANKASHLSDDDKFCLIMAALLHDIFKPIVTKEIERNGRQCIIAPKHEYLGLSYLVHKIQSLNISRENSEKILGMVGYHQAPKMMVIREATQWNYMNLSRKARLDLLYYLEVADMKGRTCSDLTEQLELLELYKLYAQEYNCFDKVNVPFISDNNYVQKKGFRALINNEIFMPEEADAKFYKHKDNHAELVVLTGLSGVGKSTFIKQHYSDYVIVSLDDIRADICKKGRQDHSSEDKVLYAAKLQMKTLLASKSKIVYDATNVRKEFRAKVLSLGEQYDALTTLCFLTDSLENIIKRDNAREFSVGEGVIHYQDDRFDYPEIDEADDYVLSYAEVKRKKK